MKNRKQKTPRTIKLMKNGEEILIENVSKYCKENKHAKHKLYELINGKINKYKDFTRFNA